MVGAHKEAAGASVGADIRRGDHRRLATSCLRDIHAYSDLGRLCSVARLLTINLALMLALAAGDTLVIRPAAWVLERRQINTLIKIGAVFLLLVGFHFDLLAS